MPRRPRHFRPDSIFHIGARGVDRQPIFLLDSDRQFFLDAMAEAIEGTDVRSIAHCLMPNHFHWEIATAHTGFDRIMQSVMTRHAVRFNKLHGRTGHLFEGRHWSSHCADLGHIEHALAYIHMNPVNAGIAKHPSDWRWSSYQAWMGIPDGFTDLGRLAEITGRSVGDLRSRHESAIRDELKGGRKAGDPRELIAGVAALFGLPAQALQSGARSELMTKAKRLLIQRAENQGMKLSAVAAELHCDPGTLYRIKIRKPVRK